MDKYRETKDLEAVVPRLQKDLTLAFEERDEARAEVERLKDARELAELRADDGWREVERLRKDLQLAFEERAKARAEVVELRKMCASVYDELEETRGRCHSILEPLRGRAISLRMPKDVPSVTDMAGAFNNCHSLAAVDAEVERLRKLCASRPKWPDLKGMSIQEVDDATEAFYAETKKWEVSLDAAGRGEGRE